DAARILDLVERRRALGAVLPARAGVMRVPLELPDLLRLAIDVRDEPARRLAVEARRRHEHVVPLDLPRPGGGLVLDPVVPLLDRRERLERCDLPAFGVASGRHRARSIAKPVTL